jgi:hypothetical protein
MAKLNARGRTVKVEATKEYSAEQLQRAHDKYIARAYPTGTFDDGQPIGETTRKALTIWERVTRRLMSDGTILEKRDVRFQPDWMDKDGRRHSYGWKVHGKLKPGLTADDFARIYSDNRKDGSPSTWTVTRSGFVPAKVISQRRIMAAIERDDHTGFCTSCGSEQGGVEPDANGYRCESCGQMSVSGAEQLLMEIA